MSSDALDGVDHVRPEVNYQLSRSVQLSAAVAYFMTHPGGLNWAGGSFPEHRAQQQVTITRPIGKLPLRHRFRADQRFLAMTGGRFENNIILLMSASNTAPLSQFFGRKKQEANLRAPSRN